MKPEAWTKMQPGMPALSESSWSRRPRQTSGSALRLVKELGDTGTAITRHLPCVSVKRAYLMLISAHSETEGAEVAATAAREAWVISYDMV